MNRRKELQNEFGMKQRAMGIFQITNGRNGKRYVAASPTLDSAWQREKFMLDMGSHLNSSLQADYKEQAGVDFHYEELERLSLAEESGSVNKDALEPRTTALNRGAVQAYRDALKRLEQQWLDKLQPFEPDGYNRTTREQ
ncbi:GIY-YIG nuclease family protein [Paenibacillus sp. R14(2021)]|uniref:GIY-YIG nuclease family protein n=1 Tax=Paenibacillus sp. R14(2021) TaxID=2859228 RepID=UPI001C614B0A|nr:GIY-YIG nuclease family protein [Paenibacillus sp. R14(2021)]